MTVQLGMLIFFIRLIGFVIGAGGLLGYVWFITSAPIMSFAPSLLLLVLSVTSKRLTIKYWWIVLIGCCLYLIDIVISGFSLIREYSSSGYYVEFYLARLVLIAYFVFPLFQLKLTVTTEIREHK